MINITAMTWAPPFAAGQVLDAAWQDRILARPAHVKAERDPRATIGAHSQKDMRFEETGVST